MHAEPQYRGGVAAAPRHMNTQERDDERQRTRAALIQEDDRK